MHKPFPHLSKQPSRSSWIITLSVFHPRRMGKTSVETTTRTYSKDGKVRLSLNRVCKGLIKCLGVNITFVVILLIILCQMLCLRRSLHCSYYNDVTNEFCNKCNVEVHVPIDITILILCCWYPKAIFTRNVSVAVLSLYLWSIQA